MRGLSARPRIVALLLGVMLATVGLAAGPAVLHARGASSHLSGPSPLNFTAITGNFSYPFDVAYASSNGRVYVSNVAGGTVTVIDGSTNHVVGEISGFSSPYSLAYDAAADELFVGNYANYNPSTSIVNLSTNRIVGVIPGTNPFGTVYDPTSGRVFMGTHDSVIVVNGKTNSIEETILGIPDMRAQGFDPVRNILYGGNDTDTLAVNLTTGAVLWNMSNPLFGTYPIGYDPVDGDVYVPQFRGSSTSVLVIVDGPTGKIVDTIGGPWDPTGFTFDPANGDLYVGSSVNPTGVWVINGTTNVVVQQIVLPVVPRRMAYDPANQAVYIACLQFLGGVAGEVIALPSVSYPLPVPAPTVPQAIAGIAAVVILAAYLVFHLRRKRRGPEANRVPPPASPPQPPSGPS